VNIDNQVPVLVTEIFEADVSKDTGIVDEDIDSAVGLYGSFDNLLTTSNTVVVCYSFAASGLDLVNDDISSLWMSACE